MSLTKELVRARKHMLKLLDETRELTQNVRDKKSITRPTIPKFSNILLKCRFHDKVLPSQAKLFMRSLGKVDISAGQLRTALKKNKVIMEPETLNNLLIFCDEVNEYTSKYRKVSERINKLVPITK